MAKALNSILIPDEILMSKIFYIRNQKVMLDRDLADLYGVQAIRLREQVKRNSLRFPSNFMFQLNKNEVELMVSQNAIPSKSNLGGYLPYVFTEHGVLMLANVLKSEKAMQVSIRIIEIFVKLREMLFTHKDILIQLEKIEKKITEHDEGIKVIFQYLKELLEEPKNERTVIEGFVKKGKR